VSALRVTDAAKSFGATRALRDASIELSAGEVLCIVGENGSGKSTLVKLLSGVHRPDAGTLQIGDQAVNALSSPRASIDAGIATVFQEVLVVEARSVLENVWLGTEGLVRAPRSTADKRTKAAAVLEQLLGHPLDLDMPVERLSLSDRQACGIARALVRDPRVLILDEATSALDVATRDRLFGVLRMRAADGVGVIFISHRMDEVEEIGDRITVMRSGETVARWLATDPRVLLLNDPTRGVDLGAKRDLYRVLLDLAADGMAIVMLSTEVDEHIELMDRVVVFREGRPFCEIPRVGLSRQSLVGAFFGQVPEVTHA
jgi:ABC-type sugar transport system ATPase subunit